MEVRFWGYPVPNTVNIALEVPTTGSMVGTWGSGALNPNFVAIDGMLSGVQNVSVSNVPVTLSAPAGALTPGPGPTQSQNRVLVFTGAMTGNVQITLPLPGVYEVFNNTTGNFVLSFKTATALPGRYVVAIPQGALMSIYNDGDDCFLIKNMEPGIIIFVVGATALPAWMAACTVKPMLLCDGSLFNFADYPSLGVKCGSAFGGNGITTAGTPDLRGRVPLAYDGTGSRITIAGGAGFNGQVMGASGGGQGSTLGTPNLPAYTPSGSVSGSFSGSGTLGAAYAGGGATGGAFLPLGNFGSTVISVSGSISGSLSGIAQGGASQVFSNVPPAQVAGSWFVVT